MLDMKIYPYIYNYTLVVLLLCGSSYHTLYVWYPTCFNELAHEVGHHLVGENL